MAKEGADFSWARPGGAALKNAGKSFVVRYLYGDGQGGKGLDRSEIEDYYANGIDVAVVYESYAARALDGFAAGAADAQAAQAQIAALSLPNNMPVYFAIDFDITDAQKPVAASYLAGAASVVGLDRVGIYGGYWAIKYMAENNAAKWFWQTYAWSGGQWHPANHLEQYLNGQNINGEVDLCRAKQDNFGQASKFGGAQSTPTPAPAPAPVQTAAAELITFGSAKAGYVNSDDAAAGRNSNSTVQPGTYRITVHSKGMVNVVRMNGTGGWWINPNNANVGAPAAQPAGAQYQVAGGDTLGVLATRWGTSVQAIIDANKAKYPTIGTGTNAFLGAGWVIVNPTSGGAVPQSQAQYVRVQSGWGLSNVAAEAGYGDAGTETRWAAIAALNGSNNWRSYNAALQPNQSVRVR